MKKTTRREFIKTGEAGLAGLAAFSSGIKDLKIPSTGGKGIFYQHRKELTFNPQPD